MTDTDAFAGWIDEPLNARGRVEAERVGKALARRRLRPDIAHTSVLVRAVETCQIVLQAAGRNWIPVRSTWRLNERHYGALQGLTRAAARVLHGNDQVERWRRSYHGLPPALEPQDRTQSQRGATTGLLGVPAPSAESLHMVRARVAPYWSTVIRPELGRSTTVLIVAHSNSLRALVMHLERLSTQAIEGIEIPMGVPLVYEFDRALRLKRGPSH